MIIHSFEMQLQYSHDKEGSFDQIYKEYFQNVSEIKRIDRIPDMDKQRCGIDTIITLNSGECISVQEKWRKRNFRGDFLIEYCSVQSGNVCDKPGWIYTIDSDYIFAAYADGIVKIYPVALLKIAWANNKIKWIPRYFIRPAQNDGYITLNVAVPIKILEPEIVKAMQLSR